LVYARNRRKYHRTIKKLYQLAAEETLEEYRVGGEDDRYSVNKKASHASKR
jgi:hypothetical protein